jgi:hypothetical protein
MSQAILTYNKSSQQGVILSPFGNVWRPAQWPQTREATDAPQQYTLGNPYLKGLVLTLTTHLL